jgi:hypothetical protein
MLLKAASVSLERPLSSAEKGIKISTSRAKCAEDSAHYNTLPSSDVSVRISAPFIAGLNDGTKARPER